MASLSDARLLVTGSSGFTGPYLIAAARARGWDVHPASAAFDLSDAASIDAELAASRPDLIVHLAGISHVAHPDPLAMYRVNTIGTTNLLDAIERSGRSVRRILLASSANVYGNVSVQRIDEAVVPRPVNHYGCSKLAMEQLALARVDRLPVVVARAFNYTGPGQSEAFLIPKIVGHYVRREPEIVLGNTHVARDFSDVRMVAEAYCRLLEADVAGQTVNVCSGIARTLQSVLDAMARLTGHRPAVRVDPGLVRRNEVVSLAGDPGRLHAAVGSLPHADFEETLAWMCAGT